MLNWNTFSDHNDYRQERFDLLKLLEGSTSKPYVDGVGDATIGIGFNLVYNLEPVLRVIVGKGNWSQTLQDRLAAQVDKVDENTTNSELIAMLDTVMKEWHDHHDSDVPSTFSFRNDKQITRVLDTADDYYDGRIDAWVAGIPESSERAALFSLAWNAPGMLGPKLKAAIDSGDRAEAWYEIRYNSLTSSLPDLLKHAIANRRYVEADTFNLYRNDTQAIYKEALDAGRMLANHHASLLAYEATYDPLTAASTKGVATIGTIETELQPAIATVLKKYHLVTSGSVEELLVVSAGISDLAGDGTGYDGTDNDDDLLLGNAMRNRLSGGAGNDILIGLKGADVLAGGAGADLFVFTAARDSAVNGKGDKITDFESGDRLAFTGKTDLHLLLDRNESFTGTQAEIRWLWSGRKTIVEADYDGDGQADLHLTLSGKHDLSSDDFIL